MTVWLPNLSTRFNVWSIAVRMFLLIGLILSLSLPRQAQASSPVLTAYPIPSAPFDVAVENSNRVWFTLPAANAIGSLEILSVGTTVRYQYSAYQLPNPNSEPYRLALADGSVWFTQRQGNRIGRLEIADGSITEYDVPTPGSGPNGIDIASDGRVWFVQSQSDQLAVLQPADGTIQEFSLGRSGLGLELVDTTGSGIVWMTAPTANLLISYRPAVGRFDYVGVRDPAGSPGALRGIAVTQDGLPWASTKEIAKVGYYLFGTLAIWLWNRYIPDTADLVDILLSTESGQTLLWGLDAAGREVLAIDASTFRVVRRSGLGSLGSTLTALALDAETGTAWITDAGSSTIYSWSPPYSIQAYLPVVSRQ